MNKSKGEKENIFRQTFPLDSIPWEHPKTMNLLQSETLCSFPFLGTCLGCLSKGGQGHLLVGGWGTGVFGQELWEMWGQSTHKPKGLSGNDSEAGVPWKQRAQEYPGAERDKKATCQWGKWVEMKPKLRHGQRMRPLFISFPSANSVLSTDASSLVFYGSSKAAPLLRSGLHPFAPQSAPSRLEPQLFLSWT